MWNNLLTIGAIYYQGITEFMEYSFLKKIFNNIILFKWLMTLAKITQFCSSKLPYNSS